MDVHGRDVLKLMVDSKIEGPGAFMWQQQLRFYWEHDVMDVNIRICDFKTKYFYEWTGNVGRLVITALTDRCYITLTMGLRLFLGGAPAGPAGTGKTETTKDFARALPAVLRVQLQRPDELPVHGRHLRGAQRAPGAASTSSTA